MYISRGNETPRKKDQHISLQHARSYNHHLGLRSRWDIPLLLYTGLYPHHNKEEAGVGSVSIKGARTWVESCAMCLLLPLSSITLLGNPTEGFTKIISNIGGPYRSCEAINKSRWLTTSTPRSVLTCYFQWVRWSLSARSTSSPMHLVTLWWVGNLDHNLVVITGKKKSSVGLPGERLVPAKRGGDLQTCCGMDYEVSTNATGRCTIRTDVISVWKFTPPPGEPFLELGKGVILTFQNDTRSKR